MHNHVDRANASPTMTRHNNTVDSDTSSNSGNSDDANSTDSQIIGDYVPTAPRPLVPGTYVPTPAFFDPITEKLDFDSLRRHIRRIAKAGVQGILTQGSNGEAVHLSRAERRLVTASTRAVLERAGYPNIPIITGCGAQSVRETVELCHDAMISGGDYAMVLPPSYYRSLYSCESPFDFFKDVADKSPIPIFIYNFPAAAGGVDLDSDVITKLARHPNIVGCKLTCGNTGKLARVASAAPSDFMTMGGSSDFTLQTLVVGGKGVIGGLANIAPRACVQLHNLCTAGHTHMAVAQLMQAVVARGDWVAIKGGVVSTKSCLNTYFSYGGYGRKPLPRPTLREDKEIQLAFEELMLLEKFLEGGRKESHIHYAKTKEYPQLVELERLLSSL
jgi:4-hydroxy-2-oxoglutarate aldolase